MIKEIKNAMEKHSFSNILIAGHIGVDEKIVKLILERAIEVEKRIV
ncbi:MAG TPA: hypothetical protein VJ583_08905 [Nitrososphaeraceae archaeon]|nr:hypothetical protein [Nitrososphaeraceae archaeon]